MIVGAVIGYGQTMSDLEKPLLKSMQSFDESGTVQDKKNVTITSAWNQVQKDVSQSLTSLHTMKVAAELKNDIISVQF